MGPPNAFTGGQAQVGQYYLSISGLTDGVTNKVINGVTGGFIGG